MAGFLSLGSGGEADLEKGVVEGGSGEVGSDAVLVQREFFWDKLTTYISSLLFGLAALNLFAQLLPRDAGIACDFSAQGDNVSGATVDFILGLCSRELPPINILPIVIIVQAVLLAGPHFVWKSVYSSQFDYFFFAVRSLTPQRNIKTGQYPHENRILIQQLEASFTTYNRNNVFLMYRIKIFFQLCIVLAAVLAVSVPTAFRNSSETFVCSLKLLAGSSWPLGSDTNITCILATTQLFTLVWACDLTLVLLIFPLLLYGFVWCFVRHPSQLGHSDVASSSFNSGILPKYIIPKSVFPSSAYLLWFWKDFHSRFVHPRIVNDLDFMLVLLFRANEGVGNVFREGMVEIEMERLYDIEQQLVDSFHRRQLDPNLEASETYKDDDYIHDQDKKALSLGWDLSESDICDKFQTIQKDVLIHIPRSVRGAVMGFGLRAPNNTVALEIGFGSPYASYSLALLRVFRSVGYINFDPSYRPAFQPKEPSEVEEKVGLEGEPVIPRAQGDIPADLVEVDDTCNQLIKFRVQDNILGQSPHYREEFNAKLEKLYKKSGVYVFPVSFIVIGPIIKKEHLATVKLFLESGSCPLEKDAVLLTVRPVKIEDRSTERQFLKFIPPPSIPFKKQPHPVRITDGLVKWPEATPSPGSRSDPPGTSNSPFPVKCGSTSCEMELTLYGPEDQNGRTSLVI